MIWSSLQRLSRHSLSLLLVVLLTLCTGVVPMAAHAVPITAVDAYEEAPDPSADSTAIPTTLEEQPTTMPRASASPTAKPSVTSSPTPEPAATSRTMASTEPTDAPLASPSPSSVTATPTPAAPTVQASSSATAESSPTATPVQSAIAVVSAQALHLREGPGARYPIRAIYPRGTEVQVLGKDRTTQWLRVVTPDERAGWMAVSAVDLQTPLPQLPIVDGGLPPGDGVATDPADDGGADGGASGGRAPADSGIIASPEDVPGITDAPKGLAVVDAALTILHIAPGTRSERIQELRQDEQVKLLGQARGAWVRVQPFTSVVPGWVYAADLRPLPGAIAGVPPITDTLALTPTATLPPTITDVPPTPTARATTVVVEGVPEPYVATAVPVPPRIPVEIAVTVVEGAPPTPDRRSGPTPTAAGTNGVAGVRVQIVTIFGDVLVEAVTSDNGKLTFTRDVPADAALYVQLPALGLRMRLPSDEVQAGNVSITIAVPSTPH